MPTTKKKPARKKATPKSTVGTGHDQGEVGTIRHDLAHWILDSPNSPMGRTASPRPTGAGQG